MVFLFDHVHPCSGIYHKLFFFCGCGRYHPVLRKWIECSFVFLFELLDFLGKFPRVSAGASLLSCSLSWRSVLKFHSVGTSLMRNFDLYFPDRRTFIFSDVCLTQMQPLRIARRIRSKHSFCPSWMSLQNLAAQRPVIHNSTVVHFSQQQLHFCLHLSSAFCLVVLQPSSAEMNTQRRTYNLISFYRTDIRECVRSEFCQRARLLSWRRRRVCLPWRCPHGRRGSGQSNRVEVGR